MTFNYSEQQIAEIESLGISVYDFNLILMNMSNAFGMWYEKVMEVVHSICDCISDVWERLRGLIDRMAEDVKLVEVKQQYKIVKRLGNADYCVYINDKKLYKARSNI